MLPGVLFLIYGEDKLTIRVVAAAVVGLALGLSPFIYFALSSPLDFYHYNVTFHLITNTVRGLELGDLLTIILIETVRFGTIMAVPALVIVFLLASRHIEGAAKAKVLCLLFLCCLMAVVPRILFLQYFAALAVIILFFCADYIDTIRGASRAALLSLFLLLGIILAVDIFPINNAYSLSNYKLYKTIAVQEKARAVIGSQYICNRRLFTSQPLFLLDDRVIYPEVSASGPFGLLVYEGLPVGHKSKRDIMVEMEKFDPDIVVYGYYAGASTLAVVDAKIKEFARLRDFETVNVGAVYNNDIVVAFKRGCSQDN